MSTLEYGMLAVAALGSAACLLSLATVGILCLRRRFERRLLWYLLEVPVLLAYAHFVRAWPIQLEDTLRYRSYVILPVVLFYAASAPLLLEWILLPKLRLPSGDGAPRSMTYDRFIRWYWGQVLLIAAVSACVLYGGLWLAYQVADPHGIWRRY